MMNTNSFSSVGEDGTNCDLELEPVSKMPLDMLARAVAAEGRETLEIVALSNEHVAILEDLHAGGNSQPAPSNSSALALVPMDFCVATGCENPDYNVSFGPLAEAITAEAIAALVASEPSAAYELFERYADDTVSTFHSEWHCGREDLLRGSLAITVRVPYSLVPIGPIRTVTGATANIIEALDGRNALDAFTADIGDLAVRNPSHLLDFIYAATVDQQGSGDEMTVRNIVGFIDGEGMLALDVAVAPSTKIIFCKADAAQAQANLMDALVELEQRLEGATPRAGIYYSALCSGGARSVADELEIVHDELGKFPMAGLFANGGY